jgi:hypothetical protein
MALTIEIKSRGMNAMNVIGWVTFDENPVHLQVHRTANGFNLQLPIEISLALVGSDEMMPMVDDLRGIIYAGPPDRRVEIGRLFCDTSHQGGQYVGKSPGNPYKRSAQMTWLGSFAELGYYENLRAGGPVRFDLHFEGQLCYLFSLNNSDRMGRTQPEPFYSHVGSAVLTYPREVWVNMLRELGVAENVLVEIPLPGTRPPGWDVVWEGLRNARIAFEQGGSTGWKGCVMGVRLALENWQKIEPEDLSQNDKTKRTKRQRLDHLRWSLLQIGHFFCAQRCGGVFA